MRLPDPTLPPDVELEAVDCPLGCLPCDDPVLESGDRLSQVPGRFAVVRCRACGLMRTTPRPTAASIGAYYPDDYGPYLSTRIPDEAAAASRMKQWVRRRLDTRATVLPTLPVGRMLEVGCASGAFLAEMRSLGWAVYGVEPSPSAAQAARMHGFDVQQGAVETVSGPPEPVDLVVAWMALEHLHQPVHALLRLAEWSTPDAWLVVSVPDASALEARVFKSAWYALHLPGHLFHFTPRSARRVLAAGGWQLDRVIYQRTLSNLAGSVANALSDRGHDRAAAVADRYLEGGRLPQVLHPVATALAAGGQTGRMVLWARRL